jgi:hypothetical protein
MVPRCNPAWEVSIFKSKVHGANGRLGQSQLFRLYGTVVREKLSRGVESRTLRGESNNLRRLHKSRCWHWVHAFVVGLALASEIHLFSVEVLHHHGAAVAVCRTAHEGVPHVRASQDTSPLCPLCQIARNSSVRPAVRSLSQKPYCATPYRLIACDARYSLRFAPTLLARSPPLS